MNCEVNIYKDLAIIMRWEEGLERISPLFTIHGL